MVFEGFCPPRRHQKRPKISPRRAQDDLKATFFHVGFCLRFWCVLGSHFGSILAPQMGHFGGPFLVFFWMSPQGRPKSAPRGAKRPQRAPQETPKGAPGGPKSAPRGPKSAQKGPQETPRGFKRPQEEPEGKRKRKEIGPKQLSEQHLFKYVNFIELVQKQRSLMMFDERETKSKSGTSLRGKSGTRERERNRRTRAKQENETGTRERKRNKRTIAKQENESETRERDRNKRRRAKQEKKSATKQN